MTAMIWLAINAMNCSDGVDGLSANLACITLASLAGLLYVVIGNVDVAGYLRVPHNQAGADWSLVALTMVGCLAGYLWYNAPPSMVLMGDSGSRPVGLMIGALVAATGNPFILLACGLIILANGATGLAKMLLIRIFDIRILRNVRFPLHDHARKNLGWAGTQVLFRFSMLHLAVTALLLILLLKVR
jgi:phospho-N-acetylmuramoyl-pentapeptide-transferase